MKTQQAIQAFLYNRKALNRSPRTLEWYASMLARFAFRYSKLPILPLSEGPIPVYLQAAASCQSYGTDRLTKLPQENHAHS